MGRLLQPPNASWEPVAVMLPKLVRQDPAATGGAHPSAAMAAAEARLEQAEAVARSAALQAASLAAAAGLAYQAPNGVAVDVSGVVQVRSPPLPALARGRRRLCLGIAQGSVCTAAQARAVAQTPSTRQLASTE